MKVEWNVVAGERLNNIKGNGMGRLTVEGGVGGILA